MCGLCLDENITLYLVVGRLDENVREGNKGGKIKNKKIKKM